MNPKRFRLLAVLIPLVFSGCAANRAGVTELSESQNGYYEKLGEQLERGRSDLQTGLDAQLKANNKRRRELVEWARNLEQAEVLLQVDSNVTGNRRLLSYQLAQLDLQRVDAMRVRDETSAQHAQAIMELYRKVQNAVAELKENNVAITAYLGSGDGDFVVRSIDIDGIVAAVAGIQNTREHLGAIDARTEEERAEEREQVQKTVDRARNTLLRVFERTN